MIPGMFLDQHGHLLVKLRFHLVVQNRVVSCSDSRFYNAPLHTSWYLLRLYDLSCDMQIKVALPAHVGADQHESSLTMAACSPSPQVLNIRSTVAMASQPGGTHGDGHNSR